MGVKNRGFTLVELIIVIAILSILCAIVGIVIPAYQEFSDKNALNIETRYILQIILKARSDAIMDGCERRLYIEPAKNRFILQKFDYPNNPPSEVINLSNDIIINNTTYLGNKFLDLKPIGTVSMGGHITLKSPKLKYKTIVIQIGTGRIYMKEGRIDD